MTKLNVLKKIDFLCNEFSKLYIKSIDKMSVQEFAIEAKIICIVNGLSSDIAEKFVTKWIEKTTENNLFVK